jgi:hypothetical protein
MRAAGDVVVLGFIYYNQTGAPIRQLFDFTRIINLQPGASPGLN